MKKKGKKEKKKKKPSFLARLSGQRQPYSFRKIVNLLPALVLNKDFGSEFFYC